MSSPMNPQSPMGDGVAAMDAKRSVLNPADAAYMNKMGNFGPDMTIRDFLENVLKVSVDDPVEKLVTAMSGQVKNATVAGKAGPGGPPKAPMPGGPAPGGGMGKPMPQGRKPMVQPSMDALVNKYGG